MLFKNWKIAKIRQISSIFQKNFQFFEFDFCTNHEQSIFGIKKLTFFFLDILTIFCEYQLFFTTILKESQEGGGRRWGISSLKSIHLTRFFFYMLFFAEIAAKYSQNLPFWSKYNADSQIETKPGPTDELLQTKPIGIISTLTPMFGTNKIFTESFNAPEYFLFEF